MSILTRAFVLSAVLSACVGTSNSTQAAEIPAQPLGELGDQFFAEDFAKAEFGKGKRWFQVVESAGVDEESLWGRHTRADHGAAAGSTVPLPDGNLVFECRFKAGDKVVVGFGFDDKTCKEVHAGHIARVIVSPKRLTLHDDRQGVMRQDIYELRKSDDAEKKAEGNRLAAGHNATFPITLAADRWQNIRIEIVGDQMRVLLEGTPVGYLKSAGLLHAKKGDLRFHVNNGEARFDDVKVYGVKGK
jgi:hypothetical protein